MTAVSIISRSHHCTESYPYQQTCQELAAEPVLPVPALHLPEPASDWTCSLKRVDSAGGTCRALQRLGRGQVNLQTRRLRLHKSRTRGTCTLQRLLLGGQLDCQRRLQKNPTGWLQQLRQQWHQLVESNLNRTFSSSSTATDGPWPPWPMALTLSQPITHHFFALHLPLITDHSLWQQHLSQRQCS